MGRRIFRAILVAIALLCAWGVFANVLSDDTALRAEAGQLARTSAGCGDKCKVVGMHGDRGMFSETITYDIEGKGQVVVSCRRPFIVLGDYACTAGRP